MKKLLLLLILFFSTTTFTAQTFNQPVQLNNVCDDNNDGIALFYLGEITFEILGNNSPNDYTITHHETLADAQTGVNPLPNMYFNINPNTQMLYARIVTNATQQFQVLAYTLHVNSAPFVPTQNYTVCDTDTDGMTYIDLGSISEQIWQTTQTTPNTLILSFHLTMPDALAGTNQILPNVFVNTIPFNQTIYVSGRDPITGCFSVSEVNLNIVICASSCLSPTQIAVSQVTSDAAVISWVASPETEVWTVSIYANNQPMGAVTTTTNPHVLTNLACDTSYTVYIGAICTNGTTATSEPFSFITMPCAPGPGQPINFQICSDTDTACFDFTPNTPLILNTLNPSEYTVTYHISQSNADSGTSPITNPSVFCAQTGQVIYARLENNATHEFQVMFFTLLIYEDLPILTIDGIDECDDNNDSVVTFDLTTAQAQINSANALQYYTSFTNAQNQVSPIANPSTFTVGVQSTTTAIFVREIVPNDCDVVYTFTATAYSICNLASTCPQANSLCNALGVPFANTHQSALAEAGNYYGCLSTQPNPTWFYLPVSGNGVINLKIEQNAAISFAGQQQDVDYIVYGPFTNPVAPCSGQLTQANAISCSYSPNAVEYPVIPNAQIGQYYIIMVTNYSNQAGFIRITELSTTIGAISCTGLRLNAFLDSNSNGTQDSGEQNFPLGQFTYEINDNGNIHNITSPTGVYNIYDSNISNSYDITFSLDSNYSTLYNVTTSAYSNVNAGTGMTMYNFPVTVVQSYNDLAVNIVPISAPRPGFTYQNKIIYTNNGNQTIASGTINFNMDALVTITGNTQAGTTSSANGFTYTFTNLLPFETRSMTVTMQVPTIPTVALGSLLTNTASIAPLAGDVVPANNYSICSQIIIGSYDPNDKMESHGEKILYADFTSNDYLYYTIRFENTGTASAVNVRVNDMLDSKLDENTIKMISASHPYILDRLDKNLNWKFDNIQLAPSIANTNTGKGYITFKIKPKVGYAVGDIIPNTASIYFDFNPAVVTNTFNTEFVQQMAVSEFENADFTFYPNPVSDVVTVTLKNEGSITKVVVYDVLGKMIVSQKPNTLSGIQTIDLSAISKGMYLLEVTTDTNIKVVKKLLIE